METYLEALERLGKLLDAGVLTKEEFEAEKAHLLHTRRTGEEIEEPGRKRRFVLYIIMGSIVAVLAGGGISYFVFKSIGGISQTAQLNAASAVPSETVAAPVEQDVSITFADASKCEPGPSLSDLLAKVRDAASSDAGSDLRLIRVAGDPNLVEVQSSVRNFGPQQIRLGSLSVSQTWEGLHLIEVRTSDWDDGTGFQLRFAASPDKLLRAVQAAGFQIKALEKPYADQGVFASIEKTTGGAILTCMKSNKSGQASTDAEANANQIGE